MEKRITKTSNEIWTMLDPLENLQEKLNMAKIKWKKKLECQEKKNNQRIG